MMSESLTEGDQREVGDLQECVVTSGGVSQDASIEGMLKSIKLRKLFKKTIQNFCFFATVHGKDWCWSWNSSTLATWCEELTHLKRSWCWERLRAGGEGDDREWDGWMASPTWWTWVWVDSGSWWWTGRPGMLWFMGLQKVGHDWVTELNWAELILSVFLGVEQLNSRRKELKRLSNCGWKVSHECSEGAALLWNVTWQGWSYTLLQKVTSWSAVTWWSCFGGYQYKHI